MDWSEGNSSEPAFHQPRGADVGRLLVGARTSAERPRNLGAARAAGGVQETVG
jgi:hypothetical protein